MSVVQVRIVKDWGHMKAGQVFDQSGGVANLWVERMGVAEYVNDDDEQQCAVDESTGADIGTSERTVKRSGRKKAT